MRILFIGPQGSGKGTQAEMLGKKLKIPYISTGNIFRENLAKGTELGRLAKKYMNEGKLVPDNVTNELVKDRLSWDDAKNGFILDGYPRNITQANFLTWIASLDKVFEVYISDKESLSRLSGRRSCRECGAIYHLTFNPPAKDGSCVKCGGKLYIREDDKAEKIKERLRIYHEETEKLIDYYSAKGILVKINGEQSIEKVHKDVMGMFLPEACLPPAQAGRRQADPPLAEKI
ncbi:MAG: adenylate kinase [bacterium]